MPKNTTNNEYDNDCHSDCDKGTDNDCHEFHASTPNFVDANIAHIAELFPGVVVESKDLKTGKLRHTIDFDQLKQELSDHIVKGCQERYGVYWPGKRKALHASNTPENISLQPFDDNDKNVRDFERSKDFDTTGNLFIEGDNLQALKLLQHSFRGKVKMIYIDPPYNTGEEFVYNDDFSETQEEYDENNPGASRDAEGNRIVTTANRDTEGRFHSKWLSMMYPRLRLARNLLRKDGVIFISIDDNEMHNLRQLCNEIFGEQNFVATIVWEKKRTRQNDAKFFSTNHDFILCIAKSKDNWERILLPRIDETDDNYRNPDTDDRGIWCSTSLSVARITEKNIYPIINPAGKECLPPKGTSWRYSQEEFEEMRADNRIWFGKDGNGVPRTKRFLSEVQDGVVPKTIFSYSEIGNARELKDLFDGEAYFDYPKPTTLIQRLIHLGTHPRGIDENGEADIVLDFFAGSGTTAHAVMKINAEDGGNRRFIAVQLDELTYTGETVKANSDDNDSNDDNDDNDKVTRYVIDPTTGFPHVAKGSNKDSDARKAGYYLISDIARERIRRAGEQIRQELRNKADKEEAVKAKAKPMNELLGTGDTNNTNNSSNTTNSTTKPSERTEHTADTIDVGFRSLKVVPTTPIKNMHRMSGSINQANIAGTESNISANVTDQHLLFFAMANTTVDLTLPITTTTVHGVNVYSVARSEFVACFARNGELNLDILSEIAKMSPLHAVFLNDGFPDDGLKRSIGGVFNQYSRYKGATKYSNDCITIL